MFETIVGLFLTAALFYAAFGFVFAIPFVLCWSGRIYSAAKSGSWDFRLQSGGRRDSCSICPERTTRFLAS